ncbi:hypothetical protein NOF04DRAFT_1333339 [Fusarium oxysporum II5]|nr:hypothetical protein NOF04DRAFT_1333339 [Fusarium oxysporum II5]
MTAVISGIAGLVIVTLSLVRINNLAWACDTKTRLMLPRLLRPETVLNATLADPRHLGRVPCALQPFGPSPRRLLMTYWGWSPQSVCRLTFPLLHLASPRSQTKTLC